MCVCEVEARRDASRAEETADNSCHSPAAAHWTHLLPLRHVLLANPLVRGGVEVGRHHGGLQLPLHTRQHAVLRLLPVLVVLVHLLKNTNSPVGVSLSAVRVVGGGRWKRTGPRRDRIVHHTRANPRGVLHAV